jgi:hypothetical protein
MSKTATVSITAENQQEFLDAASTVPDNSINPVVPPVVPPVESPKAPPADAKAESLEIPEAAAAAEAEVVEQLDLQPFYEEYANTGTLADESRATIKARLEKAGFATADDLIDQHMAGAKSSVETIRQSIFSHVGGEASYVEMVQWASNNLPAEDIADFNEAVKNPKMVKLAVSGLNAQFKAAQAQAPTAPTTKRVQPPSNVSATFEPIRSDQQVAELVSDKRYSTDPGYKEVVDQRILQSMKAGYLK